jgi:hypothetical protein
MERSKILETLKNLRIDANTVSLYVNPYDFTAEGDLSEPHAGRCALTGVYTEVGTCSALTGNGDVVYFDVSTNLIHGTFGRLVGAF